MKLEETICGECGGTGNKFNDACTYTCEECNGTGVSEIINDNWTVGDKFTSPETGDAVFTAIEVSKYYVEAKDARSRAGVTSFAKSYIKKIPQ